MAQLTEQQIRDIVRQEMGKVSSASRFEINPIQRHVHNGLDSPKVTESNIIRNIPVSGNITMAQATTYTIGLGISPTPASLVIFNGIVYHTSGSIDMRAHCYGTANLGPSFYLQPGSSTAVQVGGPQQEMIQSSTMFLVDSSVNPPVVRVIADEGHIIDVEYSGIKARATVTSYTTNSITVDVTTLAAGWTIQGNWIII